MAGTDVLQYKDGSKSHDHVYYGNGCPGESATTCLSRIVQTNDNESQKNGTYYNFQAITSGSGAIIEDDNTNAPDTFCPLGWQLPYGGTDGDYYDKSKSWKYLFTFYSIIISDQTSNNKIKTYPLSNVPSGYYNLDNGYLYYQTQNGYNNTLTIASKISAYRLRTTTNSGFDLNSGSKAPGMPVRCV